MSEWKLVSESLPDEKKNVEIVMNMTGQGYRSIDGDGMDWKLVIPPGGMKGEVIKWREIEVLPVTETITDVPVEVVETPLTSEAAQ